MNERPVTMAEHEERWNKCREAFIKAATAVEEAIAAFKELEEAEAE